MPSEQSQRATEQFPTGLKLAGTLAGAAAGWLAATTAGLGYYGVRASALAVAVAAGLVVARAISQETDSES